MPFFSVIVPAFNVSPYVGECLESLVGQSLRDLEVIVVDDGSSDETATICRRFESADGRVRLVEKTNGGLSSARNAGMARATGDYLVFVDGDDYYDDPQFLSLLRCHLQGSGLPDMVVFGRKSHYPDRDADVPDSAVLDEGANGLDVASLLERLVRSDSLSISACTRATRRQFALEHRLWFEEGLLSEDIEWTLRAFNVASSVSVIDAKPYVHRRGRPGSISGSVGAQNLRDGIRTIEKYASEFEYTSDRMRQVLQGFIAYEFCVFCGLMLYSPPGQRKGLLVRLERLQWLLTTDMSPKVRLVRKLVRFLGFRSTVRVLGAYLRYRRR